MDCGRKDCIHFDVCEEWKLLGNDNYINGSMGDCDHYNKVKLEKVITKEKEVDTLSYDYWKENVLDNRLKTLNNDEKYWMYLKWIHDKKIK